MLRLLIPLTVAVNRARVTRSVERWKYQPKIVDNTPQWRRGVQTTVVYRSFQIKRAPPSKLKANGELGSHQVRADRHEKMRLEICKVLCIRLRPVGCCGLCNGASQRGRPAMSGGRNRLVENAGHARSRKLSAG